MDFPEPLLAGRLLRRYRRFLADVRLDDGREVTVHCPNTGSMMGCAEPGYRVWLSRSRSPGRKYPLTWEMVEVCGGVLVGVNTARTNALVREAIAAGVIAELNGYDTLRSEVRAGRAGTRLDLLLERAGERCYVEVKNVTAAVRDGVALFPDAVSARGTRHLRALAAAVESGARALVCFCAQRADAREVRPADAIDPEYGRVLREVLAQGVEAIACRATVSPRGIWVREPIPVVCP